MRSCDREASFASALIRLVMTRGAGRAAPGNGAEEVTSNSTASSVSKQEVISFTEQRESQETERYSPRAHTWEQQQGFSVMCSALVPHSVGTAVHGTVVPSPKQTHKKLPHECRPLLCYRRWLWFRRTPAGRATDPPPERGGAYTTSAGGNWTPCRERREKERRCSSEEQLLVGQNQHTCLPVNLSGVRGQFEEQAASLQHHQHQVG